LKSLKHHNFAYSHNISYQLSSYIPTITFLSQFIAIRTIESSSSIHTTSIVTKIAKIGKQSKDPIGKNEDSRV